MTHCLKLRPALLAAVLFGVSVMPGLAQQRPAPAPPSPPAAPAAAPVAVPSEPRLTTAAYGDWVLRCSREGDGAAQRRVCEIAQTIQVQGQQGPLAQVALGRVQRTDPLKMTVVLPTSISFPSTVRVEGDPDRVIVELAWRRCIPGACIADLDLQAAALAPLRARTEPARLTYKDAGNRDVAVPLSLTGLAQALDALAKE